MLSLHQTMALIFFSFLSLSPFLFSPPPNQHPSRTRDPRHPRSSPRRCSRRTSRRAGSTTRSPASRGRRFSWARRWCVEFLFFLFNGIDDDVFCLLLSPTLSRRAVEALLFSIREERALSRTRCGRTKKTKAKREVKREKEESPERRRSSSIALPFSLLLNLFHTQKKTPTF